uniref:Uncharacterized protein n=1 Tax=Thermosporothrix sp. COM3 TaxID=2490863 RepID=A0A455STM2_9CHLR|nr:hypothetical protein KTC_64780 [Thermosporothrix sp. COM3]
MLAIPSNNLSVLHACSRARRTPFPDVYPYIVARIVQIREHPPEQVQRVPGARTIRAFLLRDQEQAQLGVWIPCSVATL